MTSPDNLAENKVDVRLSFFYIENRTLRDHPIVLAVLGVSRGGEPIAALRAISTPQHQALFPSKLSSEALKSL